MPFLEVGAKKLLKKQIKIIFYENDLSNISKSKYNNLYRTPIDKRLKPNLISFYGLIKTQK